MRLQPSLVALGAALAVLCTWPLAASAQTAYSLTVLSKPSGADKDKFVPVHLDNQGNVRGGMQYVSGYTLGTPGQACTLCPVYLAKPVTWAAGNAASATPAVGSPYLFPFVANDKGTLVGASYKKGIPAVTFYADNRFPFTLLETLPGVPALSGLPQTMAMRKGSTDTPAPKPGGNAAALFMANAMNNLDWVVGRSSTSSLTSRNSAAIWRNGAVSLLDAGSYNASDALDVNESGIVAGYVERDQPPPNENGIRPDVLPAVWTDGHLSWVGDNTLIDYRAAAVNDAGQVLVVNSALSRAFLLQDGVLTPVTDGLGNKIAGMALNNQGTVVGCRRPPGYRGPHTPFIWKNGVMLDLAQELAAQGVTLPTGMALGCPLAINASGSILSYYRSPSDATTLTWVRINAR